MVESPLRCRSIIYSGMAVLHYAQISSLNQRTLVTPLSTQDCVELLSKYLGFAATASTRLSGVLKGLRNIKP